MIAVSVDALVDAPAPRAGITITDLGVGDSLVSVWRSADGEREPVRGARRAVMNDSAYVVDFDVPLGRPVSYEVEVITGPTGAARVTADPFTVTSATGWLMDPLIPQSAVSIELRTLPGGQATFAAAAMGKLDYAADTQVFKILGSNKPMALFGQRMAATGVDLSLITSAAEENTRLRNLLQSSAQLLVRVPLSWTDSLPGSCFALIASVSEVPFARAIGGVVTQWNMTGDVVAAPAIKVLTATFTYGDVSILMDTYQQKQDLMSGKTYLDDLKSPLG